MHLFNETVYSTERVGLREIYSRHWYRASNKSPRRPYPYQQRKIDAQSRDIARKPARGSILHVFHARLWRGRVPISITIAGHFTFRLGHSADSIRSVSLARVYAPGPFAGL